MARVRVTINPKGLNAALSQKGVRRELARIAEQTADRARSTAPTQTGEYRDSIHSDVVDGWVRPRGRVFADADYSMSVEAKTGNLARALGAQ